MSDVTDSPVGWVNAHVKRYLESGGSRGHRWSGTDTLLLTTRGRRTGLLRRTALIYGRDGNRFVVVGSNGGKAHHPEWYLNLRHDPEVRVQVGAEVFDARADTATGATRERLWAMMVEIFPEYDRFRTRTAREIPVVRIVPS
ncbi:nitroreductase/quinone reductase family protein [Amycolatopsis sp.]|uniref:nitroreductase/quinone reductase family protein n=1 Tax=Amycolatopsis sp. TaxID=37632 RepID=UPI002D7F4032|nr:nitroreductase/quinone reductase family protein [Amycolatopsis sp.]HET6705178.1 nitroreductase/quinone reductase family protein [Amycolatopsis sp.]